MPSSPRQLVHLRLVGEADLGRTEAAHRSARGVVRVDDGRLDLHVGHLVRPGGEGGSVADHRWRGGRVRAAVEHETCRHRDELAVAGRSVAHPDARGVAVDVAVEGFLAPVAELDGLAGAKRQEAGVDLHVDVLARPERPAHAGEVQAHLLLRQAEARGDLLAVDVQPLRGDVEVETTVVGGHRQPRLGTERGLVLHRRLVVALDPDLGGRARRLAADDVHVSQHVAELVQLRRIGRKRLLHVEHARQRLELELDAAQRSPRLMGAARRRARRSARRRSARRPRRAPAGRRS